MSNGLVPGDGGSSGVGTSVGPCGACKFLRRKCVKGCIFAPYFESDQLGTAHFAAVHKVFGASNASKLLLRIPPHKRLDAVVSLCYEALARVRDPTYGCVAHIFTLQQHVVNLQAELAYTQAHLSTLRSLPPVPSYQLNDCLSPQQEQPGLEDFASFCNFPIHQEELEDAELQALAREFVTRYLPGVRFRPSSTSSD